MQNSRDPKRVAAVCFIARTEFYANACFYYFRLLYLRMKVLRSIALCLIAIVALAGCDGARSGSAVDFELLQRELREGDLLFRRGMGVVGRVVVAADDDGYYSHVGVATSTDGRWCVVHAVPDEPDFEGDFDRVKCEPVELFFDAMRAGNGAVYRTQLPDTSIRQVVAAALRLSAEQRRFDYDYNLEDTTALYCTEFVEYVFEQGGVSISEGRRTFLNFPSMTGDYIMPSDLIENNQLTLIYSF